MGRSGADDSRPLVRQLENSGTSGGRRLARVAAQWLREHLTDNLSVGDLCRALNARERTLHAAFCNHVGTSPKAYLKQLRLTAARRDLFRAERGTRVTDVALRWGFLHFGWFAHDYGRHFGEVPSVTLRRAVSRASRRAHPALGRRVTHHTA